MDAWTFCPLVALVISVIVAYMIVKALRAIERYASDAAREAAREALEMFTRELDDVNKRIERIDERLHATEKHAIKIRNYLKDLYAVYLPKIIDRMEMLRRELDRICDDRDEQTG